ncbi:MAG: hypothetical protein IPI17_12525 [Nitrosomonas sp.]|nr:hypothetical protein [Nitrosomonas sp.]
MSIATKRNTGVEPICRQIQIAPSSYYEHKVRERDPDRLPDRIKRDMRLELDIQRVWKDNFGCMVLAKYGGSCCEKVLVLLVVRSNG